MTATLTKPPASDTDTKTYKVRLNTVDGEKDIQNPAGMTVLDAAEDPTLNTNIVHQEMPRLCRWGSCGACVGKLKNGTIDQPDGTFLTEEEKARGWILTCVAKPTSEDVEIDTEKY